MKGNYYLKETGKQVQEAITNVREKTIYNNATRVERGLMAANDKRKLDQLNNSEALSILEIDTLLNF